MARTRGHASDPLSATLEASSRATLSQDYAGLRAKCRGLYRA